MNNTQRIEPTIDNLTVVPGELINTIVWSTPRNVYGDCVISLVRLPPFPETPLIESTITMHYDADVVPGVKYTYTISCMDSRGLQSVPLLAFGIPLEESVDPPPPPPPPPPPGGGLYVSPNGAENAAGTLEAPTTVAHAMTVVLPGDTVTFLPGVYTDTVPVATGTAVVNVTRSGAPNAKIKLLAQLGAIIENPTGYGIYCKNVSDVIIEGFAVRNCGLKGIAARESSPTDPMAGNEIRSCNVNNTTQEGVYLSQWSNGIIEDCDIDTVGLSGVETTGHGIYLANAGSKNVVFRDVRVNLTTAAIGAAIHMNGDTSSSAGTDGLISGILIENCTLFGGIKGVSGDGVTDSIIRNCIIDIQRNGARFGHGIRLYQSDGANGPKSMQIYNNTIRAGVGGSASAIRLTTEAGPQTAIFNNLTMSPDQYYFTGPSAANLNGANFDVLNYTPVPAAQGSGILELNGVEAPLLDINGVERDEPISIGAVE